jgi:hypothetical protein
VKNDEMMKFIELSVQSFFHFWKVSKLMKKLVKKRKNTKKEVESWENLYHQSRGLLSQSIKDQVEHSLPLHFLLLLIKSLL